mmetsp:Transcript_72468/g.206330  ORF Transcript_72468/g.206330 Transcript_72468/m.206330 type:complete len:294 (+) Transcript_72468:2216-3097(+)
MVMLDVHHGTSHHILIKWVDRFEELLIDKELDLGFARRWPVRAKMVPDIDPDPFDVRIEEAEGEEREKRRLQIEIDRPSRPHEPPLLHVASTYHIDDEENVGRGFDGAVLGLYLRFEDGHVARQHVDSRDAAGRAMCPLHGTVPLRLDGPEVNSHVGGVGLGGDCDLFRPSFGWVDRGDGGAVHAVSLEARRKRSVVVILNLMKELFDAHVARADTLATNTLHCSHWEHLRDEHYVAKRNLWAPAAAALWHFVEPFRELRRCDPIVHVSVVVLLHLLPDEGVVQGALCPRVRW